MAALMSRKLDAQRQYVVIVSLAPLFLFECRHHPTMPLKVIVIITKCCDPNIFQETATRGHYQLIFSAFHMYILN